MTLKMKLVTQTNRYVVTGPVDELIKAASLAGTNLNPSKGKAPAYLSLSPTQAGRVAKKMAYVDV